MNENNRWIAWEGGDCPPDADEGVEVRFRSGTTTKSLKANYWCWRHENHEADIVAYRQVEESEANRLRRERDMDRADEMRDRKKDSNKETRCQH